MTITGIQTDQVRTIAVRDEIAPTGNTALEVVLGNIDSRVKDPFSISLGVFTIAVGSSSVVTGPSGKRKSPVPGEGQDFSGITGTLNITNAAVTGDFIAPTLPSLTANFFVKAGLEVRTDNKIYIVFGSQGASLPAATAPTFTSDAYPVGVIELQANGSGGVGAFVQPTLANVLQFTTSGGAGLPAATRTRLGILAGNAYEAYSSTEVIGANDSYPAAISKLDEQIGLILTSTPQEEVQVLGAPATTFTVAGPMTWNASNSVLDIAVYWNGKKLNQDTTGGSLKDFKKIDGTNLEFTGTIPAGAEIVVRRERTGGGGGGGGSSFSFSKSYKNLTGSLIPFGSAVAFEDDGSIALADANVISLSDFAGVTTEAINDDAYGDVCKLGNCAGVLVGLGAIPGQQVYLGATPGSLTLTPSAGPTDTILSLGRAEPPDGVQQATCTDLFIAPQLISEP